MHLCPIPPSDFKDDFVWKLWGFVSLELLSGVAVCQRASVVCGEEGEGLHGGLQKYHFGNELVPLI